MVTRNADWKFLFTTAALVALTGVPTLASLLQGNEPEVAMVLRPREQKARQPASLPHLQGPEKKVVIEDVGKELNKGLQSNLINYSFKCPKNAGPKNVVIQGSYVQLTGVDCNKKPRLGSLSIVNRTNGFTASVFQLDSKQYQTDLIQLREGENQIHIRYEPSSSGASEEYVLNVKSGSI